MSVAVVYGLDSLSSRDTGRNVKVSYPYIILLEWKIRDSTLIPNPPSEWHVNFWFNCYTVACLTDTILM